MINKIDRNNWTLVSDFVLLGFTENKKLKLPLFVFFSLVYFLTVLCNIGMAVIIWISPQLYVAMYIFLFNLSLLDTFFSTCICPKMLATFITKTHISFIECATQLFFGVTFGTSECFILVFMAYDRYVAICSPLSYLVIMTNKLCFTLVTISHITGVLHSLIHTVATFSISFCKSKIHHFFCDIHPLLKLSCQETTTNEILLFAFTGSITMFCIMAILLSYLCIVCAIFKISSAGLRHRTFSTCSSHLISVLLFYGSTMFTYVRPNSKYKEQDLSGSIFYTAIIPMLNPFIYSLRNRDVKNAIRKTLGARILCNGL
ncbi:olfactory receptor 1019-like [Bombina bombina]|uniref:olfactory receptor 1019-like n=1 Tax=Bombina bombina TaxID=8345 RepID=UPI00235A70EA|nr:olfactory receptor 1019-like [Bombina bombina]